MITTLASDGTEIRAYDQGTGPVILVVHPGLDDGRSWARVASTLSKRFRVVRVVRRHYRLDVPFTAYSIDREVSDVVTLAAHVGGPMVLVGHSSGGVVALEALVAAPAMFAGALLFEPPLGAGAHHPGPDRGLRQARMAAAAGKPGKALQIFTRDVVGMPAYAAWLTRPAVAALPKMRRLALRQLYDLDGVERPTSRYARIAVPTVLLGGARSPAHLGASLGALANVMPNATKVVLPRRDHTAHLRAPGDVAAVIERLADRVLGSPPDD
ncbi:MAG: alpha/beta hydrolase [Actinomycetota bacterium]|nr:alpha/beta hydrolase [Actinomycetota bacterium]